MSPLLVQLDADQLTEIIQSAVKNAIESFPKIPSQEEPEKPLTVAQTAKYLSLSCATVYTLISRGELPAKKRSKRCYFFASDLNNYLKEGSKKTNKEIEEAAEKHLKKNEQKKC